MNFLRCENWFDWMFFFVYTRYVIKVSQNKQFYFNLGKIFYYFISCFFFKFNFFFDWSVLCIEENKKNLVQSIKSSNCIGWIIGNRIEKMKFINFRFHSFGFSKSPKIYLNFPIELETRKDLKKSILIFRISNLRLFYTSVVVSSIEEIQQNLIDLVFH